jgi:hypothetical protein
LNSRRGLALLAPVTSGRIATPQVVTLARQQAARVPAAGQGGPLMALSYLNLVSLLDAFN